MRPSTVFCLVILLLVINTSAGFCYESEKWDEWKATDTVLKKGNMGIRSGISGGSRLIDDLCTLNSLGLNLIVFADTGSSHNLRTWLLTKGFCYFCSSPSIADLPGSLWQGNADEPSVLGVGSLGFCCSDEGGAGMKVLPFTRNNRCYLIGTSEYLYEVGAGNCPETQDSFLKTDLKTKIPNKWSGLPDPPENPMILSPLKLQIMDGVLNEGEEGAYYRFQYRTKQIKKLSDFSSWFRGSNGGNGRNSYCQFSIPWPATSDADYFMRKYDECASLRDLFAFCDVTVPDANGLLSIGETEYKAVLGGGWKTSPAFCFHNYDIGRNCNAAYEGLWLDPSLMQDLPETAPMPGNEEPVKTSLEELMESLRTTKRNYVSQFIVSGQESSLKLEMNNLSGSRIAAMGDSIDPPQGARIKLTVDYQNLTPKTNLFLEDASLVVIFQYVSGQTHSREISFTGLHNPLRNYMFTRHSGREVKIRTFSRVFDNFQNIRGIYGKIRYSEPSDTSMESLSDYYSVKKRSSVQHTYTAFTTPIWVRRD